MSTFPWRIHGGRTLAYTLDGREIPRLFAEDFEMSGGEAALLLQEGKPVEVLTAATMRTGGGLGWVRKFFARGADIRVVFLTAEPVELLCHLGGVTADGMNFAGALKLLFEIAPVRMMPLLGFTGGRPALADSDLAGKIAAEINAVLAPELDREKREVLRSDPAAAEKLRQTVVDHLKKLAAEWGFRISGIGLVWAADDLKQERMAAAAARQEAATADFEAAREGEERKRAAQIAREQLEVLGWLEKPEILEERGLTEVLVRAALGVQAGEGEGREAGEAKPLDVQVSEKIAEVSAFVAREEARLGELERLFPEPLFTEPAPETAQEPESEPEAEPEAAQTPEPEEELEAWTEKEPELQAEAGSEPEPGRVSLSETEPEPEPEPPHEAAPEAVAEASLEQDQEEELEAETGKEPEAQPEDEPEDSPAPEPVPVSAPEPSPAPAQKRTKPGEEKTSFPWRTCGAESIASLLEDAEIPRILRKDFSVQPDEALLVMKGGRCEDVISRGTEATSGGLPWVRKLFAGGSDVQVMFVSTAPFNLEMDLQGTDLMREEVYGEVAVRLRVSPAAAARLTGALGEGGQVCRDDLSRYLLEKFRPAFLKELATCNPITQGFERLEWEITGSLKKELPLLGLELESAAFDWARDEASFDRVERSFGRREEARWRFGLERRVNEAHRRLELAKRRLENLAALVRLDETARADLVSIMARAALGAKNIRKDVPPAVLAGQAAAAAKAEAVRLNRELAVIRDETRATMRRGTPSAVRLTRPESLAGDVGEFLQDSGDESNWFAGQEAEYLGVRREPLAVGPEPAAEAAAPLQEEVKPSPLTGIAHVNGNNGDNDSPLRIGGAGVMHTISTRCPDCMAPLRKDALVCGNCGRKMVM